MKLHTTTLIAFLLIFSACSSAPKLGTSEWRNQNRGRFVELLKHHDVKDALPYTLIFDGSDPSDQALLAQFHLFSCQPSEAQRYIEEIPNPAEKKLFEAVLYGLVSEDEAAAPAKNSEKGLDTDATYATQPSEIAQQPEIKVIVPLNPGDEIWQDEWQEIATERNDCVMPRIKNLAMRKLARDTAKELFESLRLEDYFRDFSVVTIALQTEARLRYRKELLDHYQNEKGTSDYEKLAQIISQTKETPAKEVHVIVQNNRKSEVSLSSLELSIELPDTRPQAVPLLIRGNP